MSASVVYLPEAEEDVDSAYAWYEGERTGLGGQFLESLADVMARIRGNPQIHGMVRRDIRAAALRRFPYVVYYRENGNEVIVVAVQHGRRSSRNWRDRM